MLKEILVSAAILILFSCGGKKEGNSQYAPSQSNSETKSMENHPGKPLFQTHCGACHQIDGSGVPGMYPPLKESEFVNGEVKWLVNALVNGLEGPITVKGEMYDNLMPAVDYLTDEEMANILSYVRQSFGNNSNEVTIDQVKKIREEIKNDM